MLLLVPMVLYLPVTLLYRRCWQPQHLSAETLLPAAAAAAAAVSCRRTLDKLLLRAASQQQAPLGSQS
jgi:hypothetical protein